MIIREDSSNEPRQNSVWSDLRAMKVLGQVQQDVRSLKNTNHRLQMALIISVAVLGSGMVLMAIMLMTTYTQLQDLRQQLRRAAPTSSALPNSEVKRNL